MDITTRAAAGPLPVSVVTAKRPFAVIELGPDASYMSLDDIADCDRLIIAATNAKRRLSAAIAGTPHAYRDAADAPGHCDACGQYERERDHGSVHDVPPCPSRKDGEPCTVTQPGHKVHYGPADASGICLMWLDDDADPSIASDAVPEVCGLPVFGSDPLAARISNRLGPVTP